MGRLRRFVLKRHKHSLHRKPAVAAKLTKREPDDLTAVFTGSAFKRQYKPEPDPEIAAHHFNHEPEYYMLRVSSRYQCRLRYRLFCAWCTSCFGFSLGAATVGILMLFFV
jgi:hypothetical protein